MAKWFVRLEGGSQGPLSSAQMRQLAAAGRLTPESPIRREDMESWVKASSLSNLFPPDTHLPPSDQPLFREDPQPSGPQPRPTAAPPARPAPAERRGDEGVDDGGGYNLPILIGVPAGLVIIAICVGIFAMGGPDPAPPTEQAEDTPASVEDPTTVDERPQPADDHHADPAKDTRDARAPDTALETIETGDDEPRQTGGQLDTLTEEELATLVDAAEYAPLIAVAEPATEGADAVSYRLPRRRGNLRWLVITLEPPFRPLDFWRNASLRLSRLKSTVHPVYFGVHHEEPLDHVYPQFAHQLFCEEPLVGDRPVTCLLFEISELNSRYGDLQIRHLDHRISWSPVYPEPRYRDEAAERERREQLLAAERDAPVQPVPATELLALDGLAEVIARSPSETDGDAPGDDPEADSGSADGDMSPPATDP